MSSTKLFTQGPAPLLGLKSNLINIWRLHGNFQKYKNNSRLVRNWRSDFTKYLVSQIRTFNAQNFSLSATISGMMVHIFNDVKNHSDQTYHQNGNLFWRSI